MALRLFDRKFGSERLAELPTSAGVYLFKDDSGAVIYVGKANNLRRRLSSYRNASRRKVHRKMRRLVREASTLDIEHSDSEEAALLRENELIRKLAPPFNVDGAYAFLYPAIGIGRSPRATLLCFTTDVDAFASLGLRWFGSYRSRMRAKEAFNALASLLGRLGHREPRTALPSHPRIRGSRVVGFRQLASSLDDGLVAMLAGDSDDALKAMLRLLLDKPSARRQAKEVQDDLACVAEFYRGDILALRTALAACRREPAFVPQHERDALFIRARAAQASD